MPGLSAQSTPNQDDEERQQAVRLKREQQAQSRQGLEQGVEEATDQITDEIEKKLKEKLEQEGVDFTVKETLSAPEPTGGARASSGQRGARRGPTSPRAGEKRAGHAAPRARQAGPAPRPDETEETPETRETEAEEAPARPAEGEAPPVGGPREEEAVTPIAEPTEAGGAGGETQAPEPEGAAPRGAAPKERQAEPGAQEPKPTEAPTRGEAPSSRQRRYEPTVAAPAQDQATPAEQPAASPASTGGEGQPAQAGEEKPEEEKPEETPEEKKPEEKKPEEALGEETPKEGATEGGEAKKPYEPLSEPEPGAQEQGLGAPRREAEGGEEKRPDARSADQEAQRQQATDLARQRQQTRQDQKQKKEDEEERKGKTEAEKEGDGGFRDLHGVLYFATIRDIFVIIFGFIPFVGNVVLGLFGLIMALPIIFFIKKQDKKRMAVFIAKELSPKWEIYAIAFAASHALTLIYLNRKYKSGGLIPGLPSQSS